MHVRFAYISQSIFFQIGTKVYKKNCCFDPKLKCVEIILRGTFKHMIINSNPAKFLSHFEPFLAKIRMHTNMFMGQTFLKKPHVLLGDAYLAKIFIEISSEFY